MASNNDDMTLDLGRRGPSDPCWRCHAGPARGLNGLCPGCVAYLKTESDHDPAALPPRWFDDVDPAMAP